MSIPEENPMKWIENREYSNPYEITAPDGNKKRLLFARMDGILTDCARPRNTEDRPEHQKTLDITLILPGNLHEHGLPTDSQFLPSLAVDYKQLCTDLGLNLRLRSRVSWECDHHFLGQPPTGNLKEAAYRDELVRLFGNKANTDAGIDEIWNKMEKKRTESYYEAVDILTNHNLIVVGSPNVNQVMVNLCDLLLTQCGNLGVLGMYLFPAAGQAPLRLRRRNAKGEWRVFHEKSLLDRDIGWAHMIRNPWSKDENRFLIYVGGFYPQGTIAAMRKRVQMSNHLVALRANGYSPDAVVKDMLASNSDYFVGDAGQELNSDKYIPAHIVCAKLDPPSSWFFGKPPSAPGTDALASYVGNVKDCFDVK